MSRKLFGLMKVEHGVTKRGVIIFWSIAVSIVLYVMSFPINASGTNIFFSYVSFTAVLFGGGAAYHMVSLMIECPQNDRNFDEWIKLVELLLKVYIGFSLAVLSLAIGFYFKGVAGVVILLVGWAFGFIWAAGKLIESHKLIKRVIENG